MELEKIDKIIEKYSSDSSSLTSILSEIQAEYSFLPQDVLKRVAEKLEIPMTQLFGVVNFYKIFKLEPSGKYIIRVCLGTACHVKGAHGILEEFERKLKIRVGETTKDLAFTLEKVNCLGCCSLGPVAMVNDDHCGQMNAVKVNSLLKRLSSSGKY
ncbi:MAG: NAD(P)H-dependent oxidoreductase subunit E [Candidatus Bathyarchaeota archaeon]|nr:NAD(P)H-dependent oxidoreductase subunit E [Candidatus Bathyarchaeota archaeon]